MKPTTLTAARCTIYFSSDLGMGVRKLEVSSLSLNVRKYAQYESAVSVHFVPRGKRKERAFVQTSHPSLVVLEGWGHVEPDGMWGETKTEGGVTTQVGRYSGFDDRWASDFAGKLAAYLEQSGAKVLADFRGHNAMRELEPERVERAEVAA